MAQERPRELKKTLFRLLGYLRPRWVMLSVVGIASILSALFHILGPKLLGDVTTTIYEHHTAGKGIPFDQIGMMLLWIAGLYLFSAIFTWIQQFTMAGVSQRTVAEIRQSINEKIHRLPFSYLDQQAHGDILSRAVNDVDNINRLLQQTVTQIFTSIITLVGIFIMMLWISPIMTLVVAIIIPLSLFLIRWITSYSQRHFYQQQQELGKINGHIEEMFSGHQAVKAFAYEEKSIDRFESLNEAYYQAGWRAQFISGLMMPVMAFINNFGYVMVSIAGGLMVLNGSIRIGDVQAFIQYTHEVAQPMRQLAGFANLIQSGLASAERIFRLLDQEEEQVELPAKVDTHQLKGEVTFDQVQFGYEKHQPIIKNLQLSVQEGQTVAIVGPTGAGKTTIVNLLMRFYKLDHGVIYLGGVDHSRLSREQVRSMVAMVLQDTWLFQGTIRDNITYGREGASETEMIAAAKKAYAHEFIQLLPEGYDTELTEDASNLSHGQRQLLTIARAILTDPQILILDEATSSVDTRTEKHIQKAMDEVMKYRTSFVIAHRLSTIQNADLILVLREGEVIETGTHQQLLEQQGFYAELYYSQFQNEPAFG